jgi:hypothetical protein
VPRRRTRYRLVLSPKRFSFFDVIWGFIAGGLFMEGTRLAARGEYWQVMVLLYALAVLCLLAVFIDEVE